MEIESLIDSFVVLSEEEKNKKQSLEKQMEFIQRNEKRYWKSPDYTELQREYGAICSKESIRKPFVKSLISTQNPLYLLIKSAFEYKSILFWEGEQAPEAIKKEFHVGGYEKFVVFKPHNVSLDKLEHFIPLNSTNHSKWDIELGNIIYLFQKK